MKKILMMIMFGIILVGFVNAETYYVKNGGNDNADGLSDANAWETLEKVRTAGLRPGDSLLFKRGDYWRTIEELSDMLIFPAGTSGNRITIGAYGTGDKPLILGSISKSKSSDWVKESGNIWTTDITPSSHTVENIVYNFWPTRGLHSSWGDKAWENTDELQKQGDYYYRYNSGELKVYSATNPADYYDDIEVVIRPRSYEVDSKKIWKRTTIFTLRKYTTVDGLHLACGGLHGIQGSPEGNIIRNNDISWMGKMNYETEGTGRVIKSGIGNGIEFYGDSSDHLVENNKIWQIYDAGVTNQGETYQENIFFRNNIIFQTEYCYEFWTHRGPSANNIHFENNVCAFSGYGWGHNQRFYERGCDLCSYDSKGKGDDEYYVKNNIFYEPYWSVTALGEGWYNGTYLDSDYNIFYKSGGGLLMRFGMYSKEGYTTGQFSLYQVEKGKDSNSQYANPLFLNPENYDFRLTENSPAIDAGIDLGSDFDKDYLGNFRPYGAGWDIGAIEYYSGNAPPVEPYCGDGNCDSNYDENCTTCGSDCGVCPVEIPTQTEPIAYYNFNRDLGGNLDDSASGYHGSIYGATLVEGKAGNALNFDGVDDYVSLPDVGLKGSSFTLSMWVLPKISSDSLMIFSAHEETLLQKSLHLRVYQNGIIRLGFYADDLTSGLDVAKFGEWNHVVATYDKSSDVSRIYVDGVEIVNGDNGPFNGVPLETFIGRWTSSQFFNGSIDEMRIYNRALTESEIIDLFNNVGNSACASGADVDGSNSVSISELVSFILRWQNGEASIGYLVDAIGEWRDQC